MAVVAPMNAHFIWWNGSSLQETHINNILQNIDQIPSGIANGFLILVLRYVNQNDGTEFFDGGGTKLGHMIAGMDHYYINLIGDPIESVEYTSWHGNTTGQTRVTVYELRGQNIETKKTGVRANTFPNSRVFDGALVPDTVYNEALNRALEW